MGDLMQWDGPGRDENRLVTLANAVSIGNAAYNALTADSRGFNRGYNRVAKFYKDASGAGKSLVNSLTTDDFNTLKRKYPQSRPRNTIKKWYNKSYRRAQSRRHRNRLVAGFRPKRTPKYWKYY